MYDIIRKKRDDLELSTDEINFFVSNYTADEIPDYQASALMMAIYFNGLNDRETADLAMAMANSGGTIDFKGNANIVDKHSTGGVGDKTTLIVAPIASACGVSVAKMSGRGLGHTGGTIDKLCAFSGFNSAITKEEFVDKVNKHNIAIMQQTADITPADKKLYALRDTTATVENKSLIASSVMSKKIAAGSKNIVLDVKCGSGAFMKDEQSAIELAQKMVDIGKHAGCRVVALITDMNQPLGLCVGNKLEVGEALMCLHNDPNTATDLRELCVEISAHMVLVGGGATNISEARDKVKQVLADGTAVKKFMEFIEAQGGNFSSLEITAQETPVFSPASGYVSLINAFEIGRIAMELGAGRKKMDDEIDLDVGICFCKKVGDYVEKGECIATIFARDIEDAKKASTDIIEAYELSSEKPEKNNIILKVIGE